MVAQQNSATSSTHSTSKKPTVKTRSLFIIAILALSLAIIFSILVYNYRTTYQNTRNDIIELSKGSSARNAEAIELFFTRHEDLLLAASEVLEYALSNESLDIDAVQTLLHDLSVAYNDNVYQSVFGQEFTGIYASIDGVMVNGMRTPDQLPEGYDPTKRQWYQEGLLGGGAVVFGEPHYDIYYPDTQVMSATKLLSDGETVVGMDITLADMQSAGGDMDVSITLNGQKHDYGHGFILTDCGVVMAHWDSGEQGKCYAVPNNPMFPLYLRIQECLSEGLDYFETTIEGVNYGVFPHQLKNGWYVVTMTDLEDIKTAISSYSQLLLLGTSFVTILASIYCFFISRAYFRAERLTKNLQGALDLATTDGLTGYSNRTAYDMRVHELQQNTGTLLDQSFVYIMIDLNDLKYINDQIGHVEGDRYIRNCCDLMRSIIPTEIYRIGGDEFAMFLTGDLFELRTVLLDELKKAVTNANLALIPNVDTPSLAIGTAVHFAGESEDIDDLIREADVEMYHNKAVIKKNRLERSEVGYSQDLKLQVLDKQLLTAEMQKSLDDEEFEVWFQPQINNANGETLMGVEALVRWRHPERGMVSPGEFIPLFEYTGMIYQLDLYVWRHACQAMRRWVDEGMTLVPVSVNVSRIDMSQGDFMDKLVSLLAEYEIPYEFFHLEVTESAFGDNEGRIAEVVNELLERGFTVAIDDFGSGYSSLSLLRNVPAQIVKLDMRFFADGNNQTRNSCIIESVIQMCKMLGMAVIAEGVEYKEQADRLRNMGCTYIQGYLYSRPLPYNELKAFAETSLDARTDLLPAPISVDDTDEQARQMFHTIISGTNDAIIVVDSQSMRLLYANPAAEELFDARFDPMHPVTCMEYCQRDPSKACEDCPARGMKPGERREFLSSDKHGHFKSLYMQLDWHGHDAFVFYRTDISAEVREMEFSYALMNNLGVSIALFRAENTSELVPVFCNKEYSQLSGLTPDDFRSSIRKLDSYGVHPDDLQTLRERFGEAFRSGQSVRCHVRAKRADGSYGWVFTHANVKKLPSGGFDAYMIFWDSEEEMQNRIMDANRYKNFIQEPEEQVEGSVSTVYFNLTNNTYKFLYQSKSMPQPYGTGTDISQFIAAATSIIADTDIAQDYANKFNRNTLLEYFSAGIFSDTLHLPIRLADQRIIWCYQKVSISRNPVTGDVEAIVSLKDADRDIRMDYFYKNIIRGDYELVASIDTKTGYLTIVSESVSHGLPDLYGKVTHYMDNLALRINALVAPEHVETSKEAMSLSTILEKLEGPEDYYLTIPAKANLEGNPFAFHWRFGYVGGSKTNILFTRRSFKMSKEKKEQNGI